MADFKTCEDCVGFEFCEILYTESEIKDIILEGDIRNLCGFFKDKENFVEVVRCKDCKYLYEFRTRRNKQLIRQCMRMDGSEFFVHTDDFCSYGERKE